MKKIEIKRIIKDFGMEQAEIQIPFSLKAAIASS